MIVSATASGGRSKAACTTKGVKLLRLQTDREEEFVTLAALNRLMLRPDLAVLLLQISEVIIEGRVNSDDRNMLAELLCRVGRLRMQSKKRGKKSNRGKS